MSVMPEELRLHLAGEVTTVCHCWTLTRADGTRMGFTDHDRAISFDGVDFLPQSGFTATEVRETLGLAPDASDVEGALSSTIIAASDIDAGCYDGARVETMMVNWNDPSQRATIRTAIMGRIERQDDRFIAELESPKRELDQVRGRWFRRNCDAELGDARCGVDLSVDALHGEAVVLARPRADALRVSGLEAFTAGWFSGGTVEVGGGETLRVLRHGLVDGAAELVVWTSGTALPAPGDMLVVRAGCDKRFETCKAKFSNNLNFQGFPHLPGNDAAYAYATEDQTFDGGVLVP